MSAGHTLRPIPVADVAGLYDSPARVKGAGESGTVGALSSAMNAVNDALAQVGAPYVQMPATAKKVWRSGRRGRRRREQRTARKAPSRGDIERR
jgi:hypothetical protein